MTRKGLGWAGAAVLATLGVAGAACNRSGGGAPPAATPSDVGGGMQGMGSGMQGMGDMDGMDMSNGMGGMHGTNETAPAEGVRTAQDLAPDRIGQQATCPVTGETFTVTAATPAVAHGGKVYLFCCAACPPRFLADPGRYAGD